MQVKFILAKLFYGKPKTEQKFSKMAAGKSTFIQLGNRGKGFGNSGQHVHSAVRVARIKANVDRRQDDRKGLLRKVVLPEAICIWRQDCT